MIPQSILVTGATGFLGSRLIEQLAALPEVIEITAAGRTLKPSHNLVHPKIKYNLGDLCDADYVQRIVKGADAVVNCAALSSPWGSYRTFERTNILTQQNLLRAAAAERIERFVYISTPSLYYTGSDRFNIKESDPLPARLVNHYARTKLQAEQLLQKSGMPHVILRPRALHGRGDTVIMPRLIRAVEEGKLRVIGDGQNIVDLTAVSNVVEAIICSLRAKLPAAQGVYNITDDNPVKLWDTINYVLRGIGLPPPQKRMSKKVALTVANTIEFAAKLTRTRREPALLPYGVGNLSTSLTMNIDAAKEKIGYRPVQSTRESLDEFIAWYLQEQQRGNS